MVILYPSAVSVFGNQRVSNKILPSNYLLYETSRYLKIIQCMFIGPDIIESASVPRLNNFSSCELYIPFFGMLMVLVYLMNKKKDYLKTFIIILLICIFIPVLNS